MLSCLLIAGSTCWAQQDVITSLPQSPNAALEQAGVPRTPAISNPSSISSVLDSDSPFKWEPFVLRPHLLYRFLYGDGIQARPGVPSTTAIDTFSPGFLLEVGTHWTFDYTPTWDLYSNHQFKDTLGHDLSLAANYAYEGWTSQIKQSYAYSSQPIVETGIQTSEQDYDTAVDISHSMSQHVLMECNAIQSLRYAVGFPDSYSWTNSDRVHYRFSEQFDTAIGASFGYVHQSIGPDTQFVTPETQLSWKPTEKITLSANGGLERREFLSKPRAILDSPTFNTSLSYLPTTFTTINLSAAQSVAPAYQAGQALRTNVLSADVQQRLLKRLYLSGSAVHSKSNYHSTSGSVATVRSDGQNTYSARLSTEFLRRGTISILYTRTTNTSTTQGFGFTSHQIGMETVFRY